MAAPMAPCRLYGLHGGGHIASGSRLKAQNTIQRSAARPRNCRVEAVAAPREGGELRGHSWNRQPGNAFETPDPRRPGAESAVAVSEQMIVQQEAGNALVTLFEPSGSGLPFAMALDLGGDGALGSAPRRVQEDAYELHYVLGGEGELRVGEEDFDGTWVDGDANVPDDYDGERRYQLKAGDSILIPPGAPRTFTPLCAGAAGCSLDGSDCGLASLVLILPSQLFDESRVGGARGNPAVEALDREARAVASAAARQWRRGAPVGRLPQETVGALFAGARLAGGVTPSGDEEDGAGEIPSPPPPSSFGCGSPSAPPADEEGAGGGQPGGLGLGAWLYGVGRSHARARRVGVRRAARAARAAGGDLLLQPLLERLQIKPHPEPPVVKELDQISVFRLPNQTNRLALVFDPVADKLPFAFGVEIFEPGHITPSHVHQSGHELFVILKGDGVARCNGESYPVGPGDAVVFPPGSAHALDNPEGGGRLYCLELMVPNDAFAQYVRGGTDAGELLSRDLCDLIAVGCGGLEEGGAEGLA